MDQIYRLYNRQASPKICVKNYFQQYSELLKSSLCQDINAQSEENVFQLMDVNLSQARALLIKHYCSIDNLSLLTEIANSKEEEEEEEEYPKIPENILNNASLETIKVLKTLSNNKDILIKPKIQNGIPVKYDDTRWPTNNSVTPYKEFLVYCRVYEPFESHCRFFKYKRIPSLKLKSVISILGCQTLYELRQKIVCQSDLSISIDISKNPNRQKPGLMAKNVYKSGFFYIEDTFYNDTSEATNIDYSKVILEWAAPRNIGPFKIATMDAQINSLCARFGFPWVYQHQGCCEHLIVLTDARLMTASDVLSLSAYPRIEKLRHSSGKNCIYCGIYTVHWILTEHNRIPHDISYFCNKCFISYNYVDGKKIGNFKAYNYPCIPELMYIEQRKKKTRSNV